MKNISIIGAGNMGTALAVGFSTAGYAVRISNRTAAKLGRLSAVAGISTTVSNLEVVDDADLLILAVQPRALAAVLDEIGPRSTITARLLHLCCPTSRFLIWKRG